MEILDLTADDSEIRPSKRQKRSQPAGGSACTSKSLESDDVVDLTVLIESEGNKRNEHKPSPQPQQLEELLLELERRSGLRSREVELVENDPVQKDKGKRQKDSRSKKGIVWAAGTGYGHDQQGAGNRGPSQAAQLVKKAAEEQAAHDAAVQVVLSEVNNQLEGLRDNLLPSIRVIEASCLLPFLEIELGRSSFVDMSSRVPYFKAVLTTFSLLCIPEAVRQLHALGYSGSWEMLVAQLDEQAGQFLTVMKPQGEVPTSTVAAASAPPERVLRVRRAKGPQQMTGKRKAAGEAAASAEEKRMVELAMRIREVAVLARKVTKQIGEAAAPAQPSADPGPSGSGGPADSDRDYITQMAQHKVDTTSSFSPKHTFQAAASREPSQPRERTVRLGKEVASLVSDVPLTASSSVFVRVSEQHTQLWRALITGPEGTPYSGGCFVFDIYFPPQYPGGPPSVQLITTGAGSVRFNPNLYADGKVCLSLLGTWAGQPDEMWQPGISTILQVLVSIQSLIFVEQPYYNEPGFERAGAGSQTASCAYNAQIRRATMQHAILDQLARPPREFQDAITAHFRLRKADILVTCKQWAKEDSGKQAAGIPRHASEMPLASAGGASMPAAKELLKRVEAAFAAL